MKRRGFMFLDALIALSLLTSIALVLVVARAGIVRFSRQIDDVRAAQRAAESYLIAGAVAPAASDAATQPTSAQPTATQPSESTQILAVDLPTPAPANWKWVNVRAVVNGHAAELVGLVRRTP